MAYDQELSARIREALAKVPGEVEEKEMFGGVCFMLNGKMCVGVVKEDMMCRIGPHIYEESLQEHGCKEMLFTGRPMRGYVFVENNVLRNNTQFQKWIDRCVAFNKEARASSKRRNLRSKRN